MRQLGVAAALVAFVALGGRDAGAEPIRIDGALGFSHFQQQAKPRIGTPRGERLVDQTAVTIGTTVTYSLHRYLAAGVFAEFDRTTRRAGELVGFDADGRATIDPAIGGRSTELWAGLVVRGEWRWLFADLGYGLITRRWDTGRDDLPAADGSTDGAFRAEPAVRWMLTLGAAIPVRPNLAIVFRLEWRIRYYDQRGDQPLRDGIVHGTQEIRPLFGVAWQP